jgi:hypothetical protein
VGQRNANQIFICPTFKWKSKFHFGFCFCSYLHKHEWMSRFLLAF